MAITDSTTHPLIRLLIKYPTHDYEIIEEKYTEQGNCPFLIRLTLNGMAFLTYKILLNLHKLMIAPLKIRTC